MNDGAMGGEESADGEVVELFPFISLKSMYGATKLCSHVIRVKRIYNF